MIEKKEIEIEEKNAKFNVILQKRKIFQILISRACLQY